MLGINHPVLLAPMGNIAGGLLCRGSESGTRPLAARSSDRRDSLGFVRGRLKGVIARLSRFNLALLNPQ
jgi:hypothetical protein